MTFLHLQSSLLMRNMVKFVERWITGVETVVELKQSPRSIFLSFSAPTLLTATRSTADTMPCLKLFHAFISQWFSKYKTHTSDRKQCFFGSYIGVSIWNLLATGFQGRKRFFKAGNYSTSRIEFTVSLSVFGVACA